ncbi:MAG: hypothetical protein FJ271_11845 [Planctomycetes bacterium]|nr:hypothetical protein [Planctomycetota bacterium]
MSLPATANNTCDIYRGGRLPPLTPDVAGVPCVLIPQFEAGQERERSGALHCSHLMIVDLNADVRDRGVPASMNYDPGNGDSVYIPDRNGTRFFVVWVERTSWGSLADVKRVYLQRIWGSAVA